VLEDVTLDVGLDEFVLDNWELCHDQTRKHWALKTLQIIGEQEAHLRETSGLEHRKRTTNMMRRLSYMYVRWDMIILHSIGKYEFHSPHDV
jgi:hypothetical protein